MTKVRIPFLRDMSSAMTDRTKLDEWLKTPFHTRSKPHHILSYAGAPVTAVLVRRLGSRNFFRQDMELQLPLNGRVRLIRSATVLNELTWSNAEVGAASRAHWENEMFCIAAHQHLSLNGLNLIYALVDYSCAREEENMERLKAACDEQ